MADETILIAAKVRGVAGEYGLSQDAVANVIGLTNRKSVGERYKGNVPFTAPEILRLARSTGEPLSRFFPPITPTTPSSAVPSPQGPGEGVSTSSASGVPEAPESDPLTTAA